MLSLFDRTTGKRVFKTGRALAGIIAEFIMSVHYMELSPLHTDSFTKGYSFMNTRIKV